VSSLQLPQVSHAASQSRSRWPSLFRWLLFLVVIALIHDQHRLYALRRASGEQTERLLPLLQQTLPAAVRMEETTDDQGVKLAQVFDASDQSLGYVAKTLPASAHIVGFSGPTDVLIVFDHEYRVDRAEIVRSDDTPDHVRQVETSGFLQRLRGLELSELQRPIELDGVSGATLTSIAILESIRHRFHMGAGDDASDVVVSLKFPEPPRIESVQQLFADAAAVEFEVNPGLWRVLNAEGDTLGRILRTSPAADNVIGYQGPSDWLIAVDADGQIKGVVLGASFDNEPYVDYVRTDRYFQSLYNERNLTELATVDAATERVEGVSGATMTSIAVAKSLPLAARWYLERTEAFNQRARQLEQPWWAEMVPMLTWRNVSTVLIVLLGALIGLTRLKRVSWFRLAFQGILIGWLGITNGDMLSQAMLVGWAQNGVPWRNSLGLFVLTVVALLIPLAMGKNLYCSHICPHGAVQQLVRNRLPWRWKIPRRLESILRRLPLLLLAWVVLVAMLHLSVSLVDIEPFDAWVWSIAGTATKLIFATGLAASLVVPMAYCRYGCPTGKLLDFLRTSSHGGWTNGDHAAVALVALAVLLRVWS
jgi:Na+-translocating ferredoxin:NAD+ oxidoreductase RnfG subunit